MERARLYPDRITPAAPDCGTAEAPDPCPITILGGQGGRYSFLTPGGEERSLGRNEFTSGNIADLFQNRIDWLWKHFPIVGHDGKVKSWNARAANEFLIRESARLPLFDPLAQRRGPGTWLVEGDGTVPDHLVVHHGDGLYINLPESQGGGWKPPCRYRDVIYALRPLEPRPHDLPAETAEIHRLLTLLRTWNWTRPEIDPILLLGWLGLATICGSLDWRPSLWISGESATGKTTLQELVRRVLGGFLIQAAEPTEAFLRQTLRGSARAVELDEFEPQEMNSKQESILNLVRVGSKRGSAPIGRGSSDGIATTYNIDAIFLCSSILRPGMSSQDLARFTILELSKLTATHEASTRIETAVRTFERLGPKLLRRMLNRWDDFQASMGIFRSALARNGHTSRSCDQYAPLLACADILMAEEVIESSAAEDMVATLDPTMLADTVGSQSDTESCLEFLLSSTHPEWIGNHRPTIGSLIKSAAAAPRGSTADLALQAMGLRIDMWQLDPDKPQLTQCIAVAQRHQALSKIYEGSVWYSKSGKPGGWVQSFRRLAGVPHEVRNIRFEGRQTRAILIPIYNLDIELDADGGHSAEGSGLSEPPTSSPEDVSG